MTASHEQVTDLFHAMRLAASGVIKNCQENIDETEKQANALARLFADAFALMGYDGIEADALAGEPFTIFFRRVLQEWAPEIAGADDLKRPLTSLYAILWSLGCTNDRQEIYDEACDICQTVINACNRHLNVKVEVAEVAPPPRAVGKPALTVVAEKK